MSYSGDLLLNGLILDSGANVVGGRAGLIDEIGRTQTIVWTFPPPAADDPFILRTDPPPSGPDAP